MVVVNRWDSAYNRLRRVGRTRARLSSCVDRSSRWRGKRFVRECVVRRVIVRRAVSVQRNSLFGYFFQTGYWVNWKGSHCNQEILSRLILSFHFEKRHDLIDSLTLNKMPLEMGGE